MSVSARKPGLSTLAEARAWVAALGLGTVPALAPAPALGADLVAQAPVPPVPSARRAGWAVPAEAALGASPYGPVPLAGVRLLPAGAPLPEGTDAILPPDQASDQGRWIELTGSVAAGEGVVAAGEHLSPGQVLARAGSVPSLLARAMATGGAEAMLALLAAATPPGLVLGPVARPAIAGLGARPIEDVVLGKGEDGRPAIALPDDPAARLLGWCVLLAPPGGEVAAVLGRKLASAVGLADIVPVRLSGGIATPLAAADAPRLGSLSLAAGWIEVPPDSEGHAEGAAVTVRLFPPLLIG
jgi:molybdopterin biosynthesis enzyme